jgi:hypothetical protein
MISIHTMMWLFVSTSMSILIYCLTPTTSTGYYYSTPCPVLWGGVGSVLDLGW